MNENYTNPNGFDPAQNMPNQNAAYGADPNSFNPQQDNAACGQNNGGQYYYSAQPEIPPYVPHPGEKKAALSLVFGVLAVATSGTVIPALILAVMGLVMASEAKKLNYGGGLRTAGFILSIVALVLAAISLVGCGIACSSFGSLLGSLADLYGNDFYGSYYSF